MSLNIGILWHMHQPYYVDPSTKTALMPWVRLHAVKGYLDMISVIEDYPGVCMNFNMTPVLVKQINELVTGEIQDLWLQWSMKPAEDLSIDEKVLILENFFKINWNHLLLPFPRFRELLNKRGLEAWKINLKAVSSLFSAQDFRDLQTWFNLNWCGFRANQLYPELGELKKKGRDFSEEDKRLVLDIHLEIMKCVLDKYRDAQLRGQVEITTTPFYHPILPLIYNSDIAKRCMPGRTLPSRYHYPEDAEAQLRLAVEQHERQFGERPRGLWPSEGSVAPELLPLFKNAGIEYFCTDEANLFESLRHDPEWRGKQVDHLELFQGWSCEYQGAVVNAAFRERPLSDFIGFNAAKNPPAQSVEYLMHHLLHIASVVKTQAPLVNLILDGENAWENFSDGGEGFLRGFYQRLEKEPALQPVRLGDFFASNPPKARISTLHSGSWINHDFDIWIGDPEENRGWDLLGHTRHFLDNQLQANETKKHLSPKAIESALMSIYAAEGSDWFWWYGPDFSTDSDLLFDMLFRTHLQNVYKYLGCDYPKSLDVPICRPEIVPIPVQKPTQLITPELDGFRSSFFEWFGAGVYDVLGKQGAMYRSEHIIEKVYFGFDLENLYFRFDFPGEPAFSPDLKLKIYFLEPAEAIVEISLSHQLVQSGISIFKLNEKIDEVKTDICRRIAYEEILECAIPFEVLGFKPNEPLTLFMQILHRGTDIERYPENGLFELRVPDETFEVENWMV